jgi:hypothetical protein
MNYTIKFRPLLYLIALCSAMLFADDPVNPIVDECGLELDVPTYVQVNDDDDDNNMNKDLIQTRINVENDLKPVTITGTAPSDANATMTLTISNNAAKLGSQFWSDAKKTTALTLPQSWVVPEGESKAVTVYVEGTTNSDTIDDIEIKASIDCKTETIEKKLTSYLLDIRDLLTDNTENIDVNLKDRDGGSITVAQAHDATVGIKDKYIGKIQPALNDKTFLWSLNSTEIIRTYKHHIRLQEIHEAISMEADDWKKEKCKFFWTKENLNKKLTCNVISGSINLEKTITISAKYSTQPSGEIYAVELGKVTHDTNPNGETSIYKTKAHPQNLWVD